MGTHRAVAVDDESQGIAILHPGGGGFSFVNANMQQDLLDTSRHRWGVMVPSAPLDDPTSAIQGMGSQLLRITVSTFVSEFPLTVLD